MGSEMCIRDSLQTLNAKIKFFNWDLFGLSFETTLKSLGSNTFKSSDCVKIDSFIEPNFIKSFMINSDASIILIFFFFFKIFKASVSKPFAITASKKILLSSNARVLFILKLHETIPPIALTGSEARANL